MDIKVIFGEKVKYYRLKRGLSQEKLGDISGLHRTYISEVERGLRNISLENIYLIAKALKVDIADLF